MRRISILVVSILMWAAGLQAARAQSNAPGFISGVTATAKSEYSGRVAMNTVNNSGITESVIGSKSATHGTATTTFWQNAGGSANPINQEWVQFDLGQSHPLSEMWIWNYNLGGYTDRGVKNCRILYSNVSSTGPWTQLGGSGKEFVLKQGTGSGTLAATNQDVSGAPIDFGQVAVRYVRLEVVSNWGSTSAVGLSELRFYEAAPAEPAVSPSSLNYRLVEVGKKAQLKLVLSAGTGTGNVSFTSAAFASGSKVAFAAPAPTFPITLNPSQQTTLTLEFSPTVLENHLTTLTLNATGGSATTFKIPITGSGVNWAPGFIPNVSATASSEYTGRIAMNTVNNAGMLSDTLSMAGLKAVVHNGNVNDMWMSVSTTNFAGEWIQYDLGQAYALDEMWVWNINQGSYTTRGMKDCKIFYKQNLADAWTQLGGASKIFTLKQAPSPVANLSATNQDGSGQPISFGGGQIRYVRIEVVSNWGDGSYVGLSEVRFYSVATQPYINPSSINFGRVEVGKTGTAKLALGAIGGSSSVTYTSATFSAGSKVSFNPPPSLPLTFTPGQQTTYTLQFSPTAVGAQPANLYLGFKVGNTPSSLQLSVTGTGYQYAPGYIPNVTVTASSEYAGRSVVNLTNDNGMAAETTTVGAKTTTHGSDVATMWQRSGSIAINQEWVQFDLGRTVNLGEMWIWNYNMNGFVDRGVKNCRILYGTSATGPWTQLGGNGNEFVLKQGTGSTLAATNQDGSGLPIDFGNVPARYVRLEVVSNWGGSTVGLSEVRFYTYMPPPNAVTGWSLFK